MQVGYHVVGHGARRPAQGVGRERDGRLTVFSFEQRRRIALLDGGKLRHLHGHPRGVDDAQVFDVLVVAAVEIVQPNPDRVFRAVLRQGRFVVASKCRPQVEAHVGRCQAQALHFVLVGNDAVFRTALLHGQTYVVGTRNFFYHCFQVVTGLRNSLGTAAAQGDLDGRRARNQTQGGHRIIDARKPLPQVCAQRFHEILGGHSAQTFFLQCAGRHVQLNGQLRFVGGAHAQAANARTRPAHIAKQGGHLGLLEDVALYFRHHPVVFGDGSKFIELQGHLKFPLVAGRDQFFADNSLLHDAHGHDKKQHHHARKQALVAQHPRQLPTVPIDKNF